MTRTTAPRLTIAAALGAVLGTSTPAMAQLEEVLVTAQKREQSLLDVPISVATLSGERFTSMFEGGADIRALSARVPGLYAESSNGRVAPRFYIRGLGNIDFDLAASQPVSIIMDEVVKENVVLKSFPLFDIERVEVLRGPQGSLFGRNTTAGIVKFDSYKPTEDFEGRAKLDVGELGTLNFEGAVGGGLTDSLSGRIAVLYQNRDDYIDNDFTGKSDALGGFEENAIKAFLRWDATDDLSFLLGAHYRDLEGTSATFRANIFDPGDNDLNSNYDRETVFFDGGDDNPQEYDATGVNLKIDWGLGDMTLTSITAYDESEGFSRGDIDGGFGGGTPPDSGPGPILFPADTRDDADAEQITQEFRLASDYGDRFNWQVGAFFFDSELEVTTDPGFNIATVVHENTTWAVFGQGDYAFSDAWTLTAGLRWTDDEKDLTAPGYDVSVSDDQISGDLALSYAADDRSLFWGKIGTGFRAPTIQGRDIAFFGAPSVADSETITSFEVGYKSQFIDDTMRLNAAIFFYEVDDIQFTAVGGSGNNIALINADTGYGSGFEVDVEWLLTDNLVMTFGAAYADTEIDDRNLRVGGCGSGRCTITNPVDPAGFVYIDGNSFPNAPETTFNVTASYSYPLRNDSELFFFTDWSYQGDTQIFLYEAKEFVTDGQYEGGFRTGWRRMDNGLEVALFGRNITDEENVQGAIDFNNLTGFTNEPRIFGVSVSTEF